LVFFFIIIISGATKFTSSHCSKNEILSMTT
jgi:hypothetical protein